MSSGVPAIRQSQVAVKQIAFTQLYFLHWRLALLQNLFLYATLLQALSSLTENPAKENQSSPESEPEPPKDEQKPALGWHFTGQEYDPETGLYYYNARYYDPALGLFTTPDVYVDGADTTAGYNRYSYVQGNPVKYSDPTGHFIKAFTDWWSENVYKPARDWYDKNIGSPIRDAVGNDAFNVMAGIAGGIVPFYDMVQASNAGGIMGALAQQAGKGTTGFLNMLGCVGCYVNFSYTDNDGWGFGLGWNSSGWAGVGMSVGIMYRERGTFSGWSSTIGLGYHGSSGMDAAWSIAVNQNGSTMMAMTSGGSSRNGAIGVGISQVCNSSGQCGMSYSGYSALNWGSIGEYNGNDKYATQEANRKGGSRLQKVSYGERNDFLTFSFNSDGIFGRLLGERGAFGLAGQLAGFKPTSVVHNNLVVSRGIMGIDNIFEFGSNFIGTMIPSYFIGTHIADYNYKLNTGHRNFRYGR